mmetsp:Transcript_9799/g.27923  ORF Transcript_9799/g.27923 Transcript_9799/m.27923 type:complete len:99 (+) Transcript_9799:1178-1474(+)
MVGYYNYHHLQLKYKMLLLLPKQHQQQPQQQKNFLKNLVLLQISFHHKVDYQSAHIHNYLHKQMLNFQLLYHNQDHLKEILELVLHLILLYYGQVKLE